MNNLILFLIVLVLIYTLVCDNKENFDVIRRHFNKANRAIRHNFSDTHSNVTRHVRRLSRSAGL